MTLQTVAEDDGLSHKTGGKVDKKQNKFKKNAPLVAGHFVGGQNSWELGGVEMEFLRII
ncbi:hypothetical protein [Citrobacter portucalensis]|uniref:Uncharacterized protein n=1 Tax=Citrobacter portucalensis TaxID=1639133 RepID=A0A9X4GNX8_9ENTR|nr:hypothetical protein [Citrobacter portucalensis]MDE9620631.1 hypothetical protein [Citrobacter portucalensis]